MKRRGLTMLVAGLTASAGSVLAIEPSPTLTKAQAGYAFSGAVIMTCLTQQERGGAIADLPAEYRSDLIVAEGLDRRWPGGEKPIGEVWISRTLGSHLRMAIVGPDTCRVWADQLPVDETLHNTQIVAERLNPPFHPVAAKKGYNPIVYESERVESGVRTVIHTEGAEPGGLFHTSRFSLLAATVTHGVVGSGGG